MSLDKSIEHGQDHRKPYYDSRRFDRSCRAHGGPTAQRNRKSKRGQCPWCLRDRTIWRLRLAAQVAVDMGR